ncbi:MAG: 1-acyl-sn-glycerol-3-phosphate acyltransferase [Candidatus Eremiobacteraeota bacterium]|nr:1-acyl-sn-glycerol-3-phosphate acyltransferase [Candidatus Eremiobacteraeota bacterium]
MNGPPFYVFGRGVCAVIARVFWRLEVHGREHVPLRGGLIVACNHRSYVDPVALGVALPRPISYMAKVELFRIPVLGPVIGALNAYPVDRGKSDVAAIKTSVRHLRDGEAIGIFPEGTRTLTGEARGHTGVALLASLSGAPVLPAFVNGGERAKQLGKVQVAFGEPLHYKGASGGKASRQDLANWTDEIMGRIRALGERLGAN